MWLNKASFYLAVEKGNIEIIKLLLTNNKLDINAQFILIWIFFFSLILNDLTQF